MDIEWLPYTQQKSLIDRYERAHRFDNNKKKKMVGEKEKEATPQAPTPQAPTPQAPQTQVYLPQPWQIP